jgi:hypothetical protein
VDHLEFPNLGVIKGEIDDNIREYLNSIIDSVLPPNFPEVDLEYNQFPIRDDEGKLAAFLVPYVNKYFTDFYYPGEPHTTHEHSLEISRLWVRVNHPGDYVEPHKHKSVLSFVIWMNIPTDWREEQSGNCHARHPSATDFILFYSDLLGLIQTYNVKLDKSSEGTLLLFPGMMDHMVMPGYTSDDYRICIAGDITQSPNVIDTPYVASNTPQKVDPLV